MSSGELRRRKRQNISDAQSNRRRRQAHFSKKSMASLVLAVLSHGRRQSHGGVVQAFSLTARRQARCYSSSSSTSLAATANGDVSSTQSSLPGLILPSLPDTPITSVMAPMVAASDYPFRHFLRKHCGVQLTYTQMIHSKNFCATAKFRKAHLDLWEAGGTYNELFPSQQVCLGDDTDRLLTEAPHRGAPVMVQLAGHSVDMVVEAALRIMDHTDGEVTGFDLNCGCPQGIARKGRYGAHLMEEDDGLVCQILSALRSALPPNTAVSAKIRLPLDDHTLQDRIPRLVQTGINFMAIHGRTLVENKTTVGAVHTDRIRLAIEAAHRVDPQFPVVANGGMETYRDVQTILKATGAVAAMSSEALLETPNIFMPESLDLLPRERMEQQFRFARQYLEICSTVAPPVPGVLGTSKYKGGSFVVVRGHLFKFLHRYLQEQPDLRDRLTKEGDLTSIPQALALMEELYERYANVSEDEWETLGSSSPNASWYRRHRKPGRQVHQKEVKLRSSLAPGTGLSVEERKQLIQERIQRLKIQNNARAGSNAKRFIA